MTTGVGNGLDDHRCRSGKRCVARSGTDPAATTKPDTLCPACIDQIQGLRDKLGDWQAAVTLFIGIKPVTVSESKIAASKEPASPLNLAAETLVGDIGEVLSRCGSLLVRDLVHQPAQRFKVWRNDVEQITYFDGVDLALQIRSVSDRAVKLLGFSPQWERRSAPCWECGVRALGQLVGSGTVECSACGARQPDDDYWKYCLELVMKGKK